MANSDPVVLLVEDDPNDETLALLALEKVPVAHQVIVCRDGQEAVDYVHATGAHAGRPRDRAPALVLLDLKLPKLGGFDVLHAIRSDGECRFVPVVVLSGSDLQEDVHRAYALGANAYLRKPLDNGTRARGASVTLTFWLDLNIWDDGSVPHLDRRQGPVDRRLDPVRWPPV